MCEGDKKGRSHSLHFKFEVVQFYRNLQRMKRDGLIGEDELPPSNATAERFKVTKGQISAWGQARGPAQASTAARRCDEREGET